MALIPFRPFEVVRNTPLAKDTFELVLRPADSQPLFAFQAGQWIGVRLPNESDPTRKIAAFSIASAPIESTQDLALAIKAYGERTHLLQAAKPGDTVSVQGPYGAFTLKPGASRTVFLAAGIGVTPFRSMIRQALLSGDTRELVLFYSNASTDTAAYAQELRELATRFPNFKLVPTLTREQPQGWDGESRRIDGEMIASRLGGMRPDDHFLLCGPTDFMDGLKNDLVQRGVDAKTRIRRESFE